jgi:hypothetical protein
LLRVNLLEWFKKSEARLRFFMFKINGMFRARERYNFQGKRVV